MNTLEALANCSNFGPWHALAIAAVAISVAWVLVSIIKG